MPKPKNLKIVYSYQDADNYSTSEEVVFKGPATKADVCAIVATLLHGYSDDECEGEFIPGQVGMRDLQDSFGEVASAWDPERDHIIHVMDNIELTDEPTTSEVPAAVILENFKRAANNWDMEHEPACKAAMDARWAEKNPASPKF